MGLIEVEFGDMDWIYLAEVTDQCRAHVNTVTNIIVP
jgi:hypothetical protein